MALLCLFIAVKCDDVLPYEWLLHPRSRAISSGGVLFFVDRYQCSGGRNQSAFS